MLASSIDSHARVELARLRKESRLVWDGQGGALAEIWVAWKRVVSGSPRGGGCAARANADSHAATYFSLLNSERTGTGCRVLTCTPAGRNPMSMPLRLWVVCSFIQ